MKRTICILLCAALLLGAVSGCGGVPAAGGAAAAGERPLRIVATIFPIYDWARELLGERLQNVELTLLLDSGADLHSYQPTVEDLVKISSCDLLLYVGGESDAWIADALRDPVNAKRVEMNLLEALGGAALEEETIEGMQEDHGDGEPEEEPELDEHIWLSLKNAQTLCGAIADALGALDPDHAGEYAGNAAAYCERLAALDAQFARIAADAPKHTLLFGDRFPFRYLADDYGLDSYAAFRGCSAETEASFETVAFLAERVDALGLSAVLALETGDGRIARTIVESTQAKSAQILRLDSLQSTTAQEAAQGKTYLGAMEKNLEILRQALQ